MIEEGGRSVAGSTPAKLEQNRVPLTSARSEDLRLLVHDANAPIFGIDRVGRVNEWNRKERRCRLTLSNPRRKRLDLST
jgi:hypothetical protein